MSAPSTGPLVSPSPLAVETVREVTELRFTLTPGEANDLYNEVYVLLRDLGIHTVHDRVRRDLPTLFRLYDGLYGAGIDGSGPTAKDAGARS